MTTHQAARIPALLEFDTCEVRAERLRKAAADRSRKRTGGLRGRIDRLCSSCGLEYEGPAGDERCPRCDARSPTGADLPVVGHRVPGGVGHGA